jgi:hypothetical protein
MLLSVQPGMEYVTRKEVEAIARWELLKHKLQYHQDGEICKHDEHLPIGDMTVGDISTINGFKKIKPTDGTVFRKLMDYPDEIAKYRTIILFQNVFGDIMREMDPTIIKQFTPTNDETKAHIKLYFRKPGDPILPEAFKEESLAYGIAPYE